MVVAGRITKMMTVMAIMSRIGRSEDITEIEITCRDEDPESENEEEGQGFHNSKLKIKSVR